jgi:tetratricopeptide (TPR) repeat protein
MRRSFCGIIGSVSLLYTASACKDISGTDLPPNATAPHYWQTEEGALAMYHTAVALFEGYEGPQGHSFNVGPRLIEMVALAGGMTDELQSDEIGMSPFQYAGAAVQGVFEIDARQMDRSMRDGPNYGYVIYRVYEILQEIRSTSTLGIAALAKYAPAVSPALRGHLYSITGLAEILLADLFCNGVPLSTMDFESNFTYRPGLPSPDIYRHAIALFDTALAISQDSAWVMHFASVGKGRALLNLGEYAQAAEAVREVPTLFQIQFTTRWYKGNGNAMSQSFQGWSVADREGGNGLPYLSSNDPRTIGIPIGTNAYGRDIFVPQKYGSVQTLTPLVLVSGIEARLIQAEAALHTTPASSAWLDTLNALRATAITPALPALTDPALDPLPSGKSAFDVRVDRIFAERAAWLFVTGHRQGDLRRLVRRYNRRQQDVYPSGPYLGGIPVYGPDITLPIPEEERMNPHFAGCLDRGA